MEKAFKTLLIILAVLVGLLILSFVFNLISTVFAFIEDNYIVILVVVAVISGLLLLISDDKDSGIQTIAGFSLFIAVINLIGSFIGNLMEKGIGSFFK